MDLAISEGLRLSFKGQIHGIDLEFCSKLSADAIHRKALWPPVNPWRFTFQTPFSPFSICAEAGGSPAGAAASAPEISAASAEAAASSLSARH